MYYIKQETVFHWDIQSPLGTYDEIRGVCIADEILSRVFDISPQRKQIITSKQRSKIV